MNRIRNFIVSAIVLFTLIAAGTSAQRLTCQNDDCSEIVLENCTGECSASGNPPTGLYGRIVDQRGHPVSGEMVTAKWTDSLGIIRAARTKTLSREEAMRFGNPMLEGYYLFTQSQIRAAPNSTIRLMTQPRLSSADVPSSPGGSVEVVPLTVMRPESELSSGTIINTILIDIRQGTFFDNARKISWHFARNLHFYFAAALAAFLSFRLYRRRKDRANLSNYGLLKSTVALDTTRLYLIKSKYVKTADADARALQVMKQMLEENLNSLVVMDKKKPVGMITESDLLPNAILKNNPEKSSARDIMSAPLVAGSDEWTVLKAMQTLQKKKVRKLPLAEGEKLAGIVTVTDLLKFINELFSKEQMEPVGQPYVGNIMDRDILRVSRDEPVVEIARKMARAKKGYALVYQQFSESDSKLMGIITIKDIMGEFYKSREGFSKIKAVNIMNSPVETIDQSTSLFVANKIMLDKNYRRLPVIYKNKVAGILTQYRVLEAVTNYIEDSIKLVGQKAEDEKP